MERGQGTGNRAWWRRALARADGRAPPWDAHPRRQPQDGAAGRDGRDGVDGINGLDGADGISIADIRLDFDNSQVFYSVICAYSIGVVNHLGHKAVMPQKN